MPLEPPVRVVRELTSRGYNADREAVTLLAGADDPADAVERAVDEAPADALTLTADHVRGVLADATPDAEPTGAGGPSDSDADSTPADRHTTSSTGTETTTDRGAEVTTPPETKGVERGGESARDANADLRSVDVAGDITGESTGTGEYKHFVATFRDRYDKLSKKLRGRVNHRPTDALDSMPGGSEAAVVGMVNDVRSTASGHWLVELEDTNGVFPALVMKDRDIAAHVDELLMDEVIAVEGTLSDDGGIIFADDLHFPDIPRTHDPSTADRHVQAALVSDVHVGSQEFAGEAWDAFADWLHTPEAETVEYLLVAGDMVEGVGVYPDQDEELDIVDLYEQYEAFSERLKDVPGDMEIVMIPGNHDAVRLAEPQPAFDEELRDIMSAHDAQFTGNPSTVTIEGVSVLMYHGVSIDEVIAEYPGDEVSYDHPHRAMEHLLRKRHVAPQFGGRTRLAPEEKDYLVVDEVPDVFHTGHVHKLGVGGYHNVRLVNSGCWQHQTEFQKSVNIDPDVATAPILDLDTLDVTVRKFV
ncbi:DNA-directed DNA polymerase II small subunit [Halobacterium litoreum]|uniref:DNA polymerase II small subunit n=1 Tax=Halobacterium litoreum TaxID=2039234 RepID=A0ABD5NFL4_9EURY|nr:DNA-directed DNA polymerase II small subunit [Halobacterium litoreum]UHH13233.1 DNA-directed DNA polymerase II small subunit [Halobacterium litoreum]